MIGLPFPPYFSDIVYTSNNLCTTQLPCSVSSTPALTVLLLSSALPHICLPRELIISLYFSAYLQWKLVSKAAHTYIEISKDIIPDSDETILLDMYATQVMVRGS